MAYNPAGTPVPPYSQDGPSKPTHEEYKASYPTSTSTTAMAANNLATKTKGITSLKSAPLYERGGLAVLLEASLL